MTKNELQEQIEAWLNHTMDPETLQAWEQRMAENPALREEIALHQQVQQDFDAGRLHLRANLRNILNEPLQVEEASKSRKGRPWLPGLLLLCIITGVVWSIWQWGQPTPMVLPAAPATPPVASPAPDTNFAAPEPEKPIAKLDPARFKVNPSMEALVNSKVRSESMEVKMRRPANGVRLVPDERGISRLRFTGTILIQSDPAPTAFVLSFFNNVNTGKSVLEVPFLVKKEGNSDLKFDFQQALKLQSGLYYYTIEALEEGEVLYAGKCSIVPR